MSDIQKGKVINLLCFKPVSTRSFVTAATGNECVPVSVSYRILTSCYKRRRLQQYLLLAHRSLGSGVQSCLGWVLSLGFHQPEVKVLAKMEMSFQAQNPLPSSLVVAKFSS